MHRVFQRLTQGVLLLTATTGVARGDLYFPPEIPVVGIEVPSPLTAFIASTMFAIAVFAVLHKRGLHVANRWWATVITLAICSGLSAAACHAIHTNHRASHRSEWNSRMQEMIGDILDRETRSPIEELHHEQHPNHR